VKYPLDLLEKAWKEGFEEDDTPSQIGEVYFLFIQFDSQPDKITICGECNECFAAYCSLKQFPHNISFLEICTEKMGTVKKWIRI